MLIDIDIDDNLEEPLRSQLNKVELSTTYASIEPGVYKAIWTLKVSNRVCMDKMIIDDVRQIQTLHYSHDVDKK